MTDAAKTAGTSKGRKPVSGPTAEMKQRREARKKRGSVDYTFNKKLALNESEMDHSNFRYRWVENAPGRIAELGQREWEIVKDDDIGGQLAARTTGYDKVGKPQDSVLMRKYKEWFDEDDKARREARRLHMSKLAEGKGLEGQSGADYADKNNKVERVERVVNPDFT